MENKLQVTSRFLLENNPFFYGVEKMYGYKKETLDFFIKQISKKWFKLYLKSDPNRTVTMTGSDVTVKFEVPFTFVLKRIHLYHMTSTLGTESDDLLEVTLRRAEGQITDIPYFEDDFYHKAGISQPKIIISFEDLGDEGGIVFEAGTINVILNSVDTDLVQAIVYVKRLD